MENNGALEIVQTEIPAWVTKQNFACNMGLDENALGIIEECGEFAAAHLHETRQVQGYSTRDSVILALAGYVGQLAHCELKMRQGIRHGAEESATIERGALAAMSQLMQILLCGNGDATRAIMHDDWIGTDVADGPSFPSAELSTAEELGDILTFASEYANVQGFSLGGALLSRWSHVRQRNWALDRHNGGETDEERYAL